MQMSDCLSDFQFSFSMCLHKIKTQLQGNKKIIYSKVILVTMSQEHGFKSPFFIFGGAGV
jgi:hypothetical protein